MNAIALLLVLAQAEPLRIAEDGGWCWFEDPRALIHAGKLLIGVVADGRGDPERRGDIDVLVHDLAGGGTRRIELHDRLEADDHDSPVFMARPDGRVLAVWAKHGSENRFYSRLSEPGDPERWGPLLVTVPTPSSRVTYSNLFRMTDGKPRLYDFFRGLDGLFKPSYAVSFDEGASWSAGAVLIRSKAARPYVRYAGNGRDVVHLVYTEGHPRDADNSLYHVFLRDGKLHRSDGRVLGPLEEGLASPDRGTCVFQGGPDRVAWPCDVKLDPSGRPVVAYSVQMNSAGLPRGQGGEDLRYRVARWTGEAWADAPLAFAGTRLYAGEDDYSGLVAIDPADAATVVFSTNADPRSGEALISKRDGKRHWELYRGVPDPAGTGWALTAITSDSESDQLRPQMPPAPAGTRVLLWLRGTYTSYTRYALDVMGLIRTEGR